MSTVEPPKRSRHRATWLAVIGTIIAFIGTSTLLVYSAVVLSNLVATFVDPSAEQWMSHIEEAGSKSWFGSQVLLLLSGSVAGLACSWLSPPESKVAPATVLLLAALYFIFAQFPMPHSAVVLAIWVLAAPVGFCVGYALHRTHEHA